VPPQFPGLQVSEDGDGDAGVSGEPLRIGESIGERPVQPSVIASANKKRWVVAQKLDLPRPTSVERERQDHGAHDRISWVCWRRAIVLELVGGIDVARVVDYISALR
jgi:hypothetical protein